MMPSKVCPRCSHEWQPRVPVPTKCPRCQCTLPWEGMHTLPKAAGGPQQNREAKAKAFDDAMQKAQESR
jgi:hypothetical protein